MSIIEGFTVKFDELCGEICALREQLATLGDQVTTLESVLAGLKTQATPATGARSVTQPAATTGKSTVK